MGLAGIPLAALTVPSLQPHAITLKMPPKKKFRNMSCNLAGRHPKPYMALICIL